MGVGGVLNVNVFTEQQAPQLQAFTFYPRAAAAYSGLACNQETQVVDVGLLTFEDRDAHVPSEVPT